MSHTDHLKGGFADNRKPNDFNKTQLSRGIKVEREHTDSDVIAREIAMDHLEEMPSDYYSRLDKMEKEAKAEGVMRKLKESFDVRLDEALAGSLINEEEDLSAFDTHYDLPQDEILGLSKEHILSRIVKLEKKSKEDRMYIAAIIKMLKGRR